MSRKVATMHEMVVKALAPKCNTTKPTTTHVCRCKDMVKHIGPHRCYICGRMWWS